MKHVHESKLKFTQSDMNYIIRLQLQTLYQNFEKLSLEDCWDRIRSLLTLVILVRIVSATVL